MRETRHWKYGTVVPQSYAIFTKWHWRLKCHYWFLTSAKLRKTVNFEEWRDYYSESLAWTVYHFSIGSSVSVFHLSLSQLISDMLMIHGNNSFAQSKESSVIPGQKNKKKIKKINTQQNSCALLRLCSSLWCSSSLALCSQSCLCTVTDFILRSSLF